MYLIENVKEIPEPLMSHPVETRLQELEDKATKRTLIMQILLFVYVRQFKIICKTSPVSLEFDNSSTWYSFFIQKHTQYLLLQYFEVLFTSILDRCTLVPIYIRKREKRQRGTKIRKKNKFSNSKAQHFVCIFFECIQNINLCNDFFPQNSKLLLADRFGKEKCLHFPVT